jgi:hypothetical protein
MLELVSKLNQWLEAQRCMKGAEESLQDCHQQMALVKEAEAHGPSGQHPLYTLATRYAKHRRAYDAQEKARAALREKIEDCDKHLNLHKVIKTPDNIFRVITPYFFNFKVDRTLIVPCRHPDRYHTHFLFSYFTKRNCYFLRW